MKQSGKRSRNALFQPDMAAKAIEFDFTGGRVQDSAIRWVVYAIIACFVLPYGALTIHTFGGGASSQAFFEWFMMSFRLDQSALHGEWWRFVTYLFLHAGLIHLLFNLGALVGLYMMANAQFQKYVWIFTFFLAGILGGLCEIHFNPDIPGVVGASAGVFGLWGAALVSAWRYTRLPFNERPLGNQQNLSSLTLWLFINFIFGLFVPALAKFAHGGGLLVGLVVGVVFPICGQPRLLATREDLFLLEASKGLQETSKTKGKTKGKNKNKTALIPSPVYLTWIKLSPTEKYDPTQDTLIAEYDSFSFNNVRKVRYELVAGVNPPNYENLVEVATPLKVSVPTLSGEVIP
jgi:membrane associated rhomboid family serine protease